MVKSAPGSPTEGARIEALLWETIRTHDASAQAKSSSTGVEPAIARALLKANYDVDPQDTRGLYPTGVPTWRVAGDVLAAPAKRRIDIVAYDKAGFLVALIESEDDVGDVALPTWITRRYAVRSVARDADGHFFDSYRSIERMAVAAAGVQRDDSAQVPLLAQLEAIKSDEPLLHNPAKIPLFLTLARGMRWRRTVDRLALIQPRLTSLGCRVIAV